MHVGPTRLQAKKGGSAPFFNVGPRDADQAAFRSRVTRITSSATVFGQAE